MNLGLKHEQSSAYNPESNGLNEAAVHVVKETLKKTKVVKGAALDRVPVDLNSMSIADGSALPVDLFLGS